MSLHLLPEWRWLVRKAWSIRLVVLAGLLSGCEVVLPLFVDAMPRNVFAGLSLLAAVGSAFARIVDQPKMERRSRPRTRPDAARCDYD
jgi:hypothetical protein